LTLLATGEVLVHLFYPTVPTAALEDSVTLLIVLVVPQALVLAVLIAVARLGRLGYAVRLVVPASALVAAAVTVIGVELVVDIALSGVVGGTGLLVAWRGGLALVGLAAGLALLVRGREQPGRLAVAGFFFVSAALEQLSFLAQYLYRHYTSVGAAPLPDENSAGVQAAVALTTLVLVLWLLLRHARDPRTVELLTLLFILNAGLEVVTWLAQRYGGAKTALHITTPQGILLVLALLWDLGTSGEHVTNVNGERFPRYVRVLLYVGYTILVSTILLYYTSLIKDGVIGEIPSTFRQDLFSYDGLVVLGLPWFLAVFVLNLSRWQVTGSIEAPASRELEAAPPPVPLLPRFPNSYFPGLLQQLTGPVRAIHFPKAPQPRTHLAPPPYPPPPTPRNSGPLDEDHSDGQ
jgi:hypothetical protein